MATLRREKRSYSVQVTMRRLDCVHARAPMVGVCENDFYKRPGWPLVADALAKLWGVGLGLRWHFQLSLQ